MENGGFSNIEKLHMEEGDEARHQTRCLFFYEHYDDLGFFYKSCFYTAKDCIGSSHCQYYTRNPHKVIQLYDQKYAVHDSDKCEFIDLSNNHPSCNKESFPCLCFGLGDPKCPKNNIKEEENNINNDIVEFGDKIRLFRHEGNTNHYLIIKNIPVKPGLDIIFDFVGKKLGDEVTYNNQVWIINKIIKTEKSGKAFIVHKKNKNTTGNQSHKKTIVCKFCKERIIAKDLIRHLKTVHPKTKA